MTRSQSMYRNRLLSIIHTHSSYKYIRDLEMWQEYLYHHFKVDSSAKLSISELNILIDLLNAKIASREFTPDDRGRSIIKNTHPIISAIMAMKIELGLSDKELFKFIARQTKIVIIDINHLHILDKTQAKAVIIGLKQILKHKAKQCTARFADTKKQSS